MLLKHCTIWRNINVFHCFCLMPSFFCRKNDTILQSLLFFDKRFWKTVSKKNRVQKAAQLSAPAFSKVVSYLVSDPPMEGARQKGQLCIFISKTLLFQRSRFILTILPSVLKNRYNQKESILQRFNTVGYNNKQSDQLGKILRFSQNTLADGEVWNINGHTAVGNIFLSQAGKWLLICLIKNIEGLHPELTSKFFLLLFQFLQHQLS